MALKFSSEMRISPAPLLRLAYFSRNSSQPFEEENCWARRCIEDSYSHNLNNTLILRSCGSGWCLGIHQVTGARTVARRAPVSCLIDNKLCKSRRELSRPTFGVGPPRHPPIGHRASLAALHHLAPSINCCAAGNSVLISCYLFPP